MIEDALIVDFFLKSGQKLKFEWLYLLLFGSKIWLHAIALFLDAVNIQTNNIFMEDMLFTNDCCSSLHRVGSLRHLIYNW